MKGLRGYLVTREEGPRLVGARSDSLRYQGPVAEVYADDNWLVVSTGACEGTAMLNIEALPYLRRALAQIAKECRAKQKDPG